MTATEFTLDDTPPTSAVPSVAFAVQHLVEEPNQQTRFHRFSASYFCAQPNAARLVDPPTPPLLPCEGGFLPFLPEPAHAPESDVSSPTSVCAKLAPLTTRASDASDGIAPAISPADLVKGASSITIGDHRYSRCGADSPSTGASFNLELDELLSRGSCGEVYTDAIGTLIIKIVEPREDNVYNWIYDETPSEPLRRYESRLQEALNEVEAYKALEGCIFVPSFYGCFEGVHKDGHKILVLVMERVTGELLTRKRVPAVVHKVEAAVRAVHQFGLLHGSVKPGHILLDQDKIFLLDFGLSRLDPDVRQAETETARLRYIGA